MGSVIYGNFNCPLRALARATETVHRLRPDDRAYGVVLLDGSDRWRSLLLGAPPLFV